MTSKLPPQVVLTDKQMKFIEGIGQGMLTKEAYRQAYDSKGTDKQVSVQAAELKRSPNVAVALAEVLKSKRVTDLDNPGRVNSDTLEDQQAAREAGAYASVVAANRLRSNQQGLERQSIVFSAESLLSDDELI